MKSIIHRSLIIFATVAVASACTPTSRTATEATSVSNLAGSVLIRDCIEPETALSPIVRALRENSGPRTGRTYVPFFKENGEIRGAVASDTDNVSSSVFTDGEGRLTCGVGAFAVAPEEFDRAVIAALGAEGFTVQANSDESYAVLIGNQDARLVFSVGENAFGAKNRKASLEFGKPAPLADRQRRRAASSDVAQSAPRQPAPPQPTFPAVEGAGPLFEGSAFAFTQAQLQTFCGQDWRTRIGADGRTEYNPCFERRAFR